MLIIEYGFYWRIYWHWLIDMLLSSQCCHLTFHLSFFSFQQVVDVNINYDARAGRSTAEVRLFVHPFIVVEL